MKYSVGNLRKKKLRDKCLICDYQSLHISERLLSTHKMTVIANPVMWAFRKPCLYLLKAINVGCSVKRINTCTRHKNRWHYFCIFASTDVIPQHSKSTSKAPKFKRHCERRMLVWWKINHFLTTFETRKNKSLQILQTQFQNLSTCYDRNGVVVWCNISYLKAKDYTLQW